MEFKTSAVRGLKNACRVFLQDLQALPPEAFTETYGKATRTVADIVFEVNLVNDHVGMVIRGEEPFPWPDEGWIKAPADFNQKEAIVATFEASSKRILDTAESFSEAEYTEKIKTEDGETTRFDRCQFMTIHLWYHSGQLNYIQTVLGDDQWHWR